MIFKGRITELKEKKVGKTKKGDDWASLDFELTESTPQNPDYPQVLLLSYFKSGEYFKYANEFAFKLGDEVEADFNFKVNVYTKKDGSGEGKFYKNDCWKLTKAEAVNGVPVVDQPTTNNDANEADDLPF